MAFEGHPDQPDTTKLECSATHSEETPITSQNDQEQYVTRKIDVRTVLGILVTSIHRIDSYSIKVNHVAGSGSHLRIMLILIRTSRFSPVEHQSRHRPFQQYCLDGNSMVSLKRRGHDYRWKM
jgi:hypothetical protein